MEIDSDDSAVAEALTALWRTVAAQGGWARRGVSTVARAGALSVAADPAVPADAPILDVPDTCLAETDAATLVVRGGELAVDGLDAALAGSKATSFRRLIEVYATAGQLAAHRRRSPWFALSADTDILYHLAAARQGSVKVRDKAERVHADAWDDLAVADFLGTRTFALDGEGERARSVVMPFIDFLNHHHAAPGYRLVDGADGRRTLRAVKAQPEAGSGECFVRYNLMDALDNFLNYAFVDTRAPLLMSACARVTPENGPAITVNGEGGGTHTGRLPRDLRAVSAYVPLIRRCEADHIEVSRLVLHDARAPRILPRVLAFLIRRARPAARPREVRDLTRESVQRFLAVNTRFVDQLAEAHRDAAARTPVQPPPGRAEALRAVATLEARFRDLLKAAERDAA